MKRIIDLHTHSTVSDGTLTPSELIIYAKEKNLAAIALTDHDTINGLGDALSEGIKLGIEVIPGVEINSKYKEFELHIIGLFINYKDKELQAFLERLRGERKKRNYEFIKRLNELGFEISWEEVERLAGGEIVAKGHFIQAMINKGYVKDSKEARDKYFYEGGAVYISKAVASPNEVATIIKNAGGIPILAHPGEFKISKKELKDMILELKDEGIVGVEAYYYSYTDDMTEFLIELAEQNGLLISGGSDFHGLTQRQSDLGTGKGNLEIQYDILDKIKKHLIN